MSGRTVAGALCAAGAGAGPVAGVGAGPASAQWDSADEVRRTVEAWQAEWGVPGAAVAVVRGGEALLLEGFGVRRLGGRESVDPGTLFELGSASKTFTATTAAMAVDAGLVRWATPLADLVPGLRLSDPWLERHVTLQDALSHRTGYGRNDLLWLGGSTPGEIVARFRHIPPTASFREEFSYSNLMYILVGEALAGAFGRPWSEAVRERVFEPLGMRSTRVEGAGPAEASPAGAPVGQSGVVHAREEEGSRGERDRRATADAGENVAVPHVRLGADSLLPAATPRTHAGPAGGVLASAADLVAWMRFHLEAEGAVAELREPRVPLPLPAFGPQYARASSLGYGTGWFVSDYAGRRMVDHIGGHGGMVANVTLLPDEGIGVAVLTNHGDNLLPVAVTYRVLDLLLGLDERPWNETLLEFWDGVREARDAGALAAGGEPRPDASPGLPVAAYAGTYRSPLYGDVLVESDGEGLLLRYGSNLDGRLTHWGHDTFRVAWSDPMLRAILGASFASFQLDLAGRASRISLTGFQGERLEAERVR